MFDSKIQWSVQVSNAITKSMKALNAIRLIIYYEDPLMSMPDKYLKNGFPYTHCIVQYFDP